MVLLAELQRPAGTVRDKLAGGKTLTVRQRADPRVGFTARGGDIHHQLTVKGRTALADF